MSLISKHLEVQSTFHSQREQVAADFSIYALHLSKGDQIKVQQNFENQSINHMIIWSKDFFFCSFWMPSLVKYLTSALVEKSANVTGCRDYQVAWIFKQIWDISFRRSEMLEWLQFYHGNRSDKVSSMSKWQGGRAFSPVITTFMLWNQIRKYSNWKIWTCEQCWTPNETQRWMLLAVQREQGFDIQKNLIIMPGSILKTKQVKTRMLSGVFPSYVLLIDLPLNCTLL